MPRKQASPVTRQPGQSAFSPLNSSIALSPRDWAMTTVAQNAIAKPPIHLTRWSLIIVSCLFDDCDCCSFPLSGTIRNIRSIRIKTLFERVESKLDHIGGDCRPRGVQKIESAHCVAMYDLPPTLITYIEFFMRDLCVVTHTRDKTRLRAKTLLSLIMRHSDGYVRARA